MNRLPAQAFPWRAFAVLVVLIGISQAGRWLPTIGFDFATARLIYWMLAPLGLAGYAYGFRWLPRSFWRAYSLIFTVEIAIRLARYAWTLVARLFELPDDNRHATPTILLALALAVALCVALLRYGGWLKTPARPLPPSAQKPKVDIAAWFKRSSTTKEHAARYPMLLCVLASLAGAAVVMIVLGLWLGQWSLEFALIGFPFALLAFVFGGRSLAEKLSLAGKDTIVRGSAIGASIGILVSGSATFALAATLIGDALIERPGGLITILAVALIGTPIGAVYGAATGAALILLGRRVARAGSR